MEWNWRLPISKFPGVSSSSSRHSWRTPTFLLYLFLNMTGILLTGIFTVFAVALGTHPLRYSRFMLIHPCLTDTSRGLPDHSSLYSKPYPHRNLFFFTVGHPSSAYCFSYHVQIGSSLLNSATRFGSVTSPNLCQAGAHLTRPRTRLGNTQERPLSFRLETPARPIHFFFFFLPRFPPLERQRWA